MAIDWVTFDCYGTLIDWESGILQALAPLLPPEVGRDAVVAGYVRIEADVERGDYFRYREVLEMASRRLLAGLGRPLRDDQPSPLPASLPAWKPFPEVPPTLRALRASGYRLAILSNVDRDLLAASIRHLGIEPDLTVTAEDCASYKPAAWHWLYFHQKTHAAPPRTVHVAASVYHDIRPATSLGYRTVFINRHGEALPPDVSPMRVLPDLRGLPEAIDELARTLRA